MKLTDLLPEHLPQAQALLRQNYEEERGKSPALPAVAVLPQLDIFAEDGLGVAAVEGDRLLGYLGGLPYWEPAWGIPGL